MANQTLTGCIDFLTGLVVFDQDDCEYSGCLVIGGLNDKQVAVTIDTDFCDDTFFGCVNFPSGIFEVVVPDNCCIFKGPFGTACSECLKLPPECVQIGFSGWTEFCRLEVGYILWNIKAAPTLTLEFSGGTCVLLKGAPFTGEPYVTLEGYGLDGTCTELSNEIDFFEYAYKLQILSDRMIVELILDIGDVSQVNIAGFTLMDGDIEEDDFCEFLLSSREIPNQFEDAVTGGIFSLLPVACPE